jgi:hypothetical protein
MVTPFPSLKQRPILNLILSLILYLNGQEPIITSTSPSKPKTRHKHLIIGLYSTIVLIQNRIDLHCFLSIPVHAVVCRLTHAHQISEQLLWSILSILNYMRYFIHNALHIEQSWPPHVS